MDSLVYVCARSCEIFQTISSQCGKLLMQSSYILNNHNMHLKQQPCASKYSLPSRIIIVESCSLQIPRCIATLPIRETLLSDSAVPYFPAPLLPQRSLRLTDKKFIHQLVLFTRARACVLPHLSLPYNASQSESYPAVLADCNAKSRSSTIGQLLYSRIPINTPTL